MFTNYTRNAIHQKNTILNTFALKRLNICKTKVGKTTGKNQ